MKLKVYVFNAVAFLTMASATVAAESVKLTGWFACDRCTAPRAAKGDVSRSNPVCAKKCIDEGSDAVFISEGKQLLKIRNHASVKDDIGYKVEIAGDVDRATATVSIRSVTKLAEEPASCARVGSAKSK